MGGGGKVHMLHWKNQQIHGVCEQEEIQELLEKHNLRDPWIRNEAFKLKIIRIHFRNLIYPDWICPSIMVCVLYGGKLIISTISCDF